MSDGDTFRCPDCNFLLYKAHPAVSHGCDKRNVIAALRAENARLREALKPFAKVVRCIEDDEADSYSVLNWHWCGAKAKLVNGDFRRAAAALAPAAPAKEKEGENG